MISTLKTNKNPRHRNRMPGISVNYQLTKVKLRQENEDALSKS
nr:MAG TPA: hypothetical protein [Caudoviricetes sp.]